MNTSTYTAPGIAAVVLAVLFPIYWLFAMANLSMEAMREDFLTLSGWDLLFVVIGALEIFVYLALARLFRDQLGGSLSAVLLLVMAGMVAIFHATTLIDVALGLALVTGMEDTLVDVGMISGLVSLFLYTVTAFVLAIALLTRFTELPTLMRLFAIGLLIACLLQFSVILGVINIVLFPLLVLLLAVHFLRGEHRVEVV